MPQSRRTRTLTRAAYARTAGNFLVNDPDGFPSDYPPIWWTGLDSGGGSYPIGPHGPWTGAQAAALPVVTRATSLITGPLTAAPFREIDLADGHPLGRARWLTDPMLLRPDSRYPTVAYPAVSKLPRGEFWAEWIRAACWWGVGAFVCQEDETGQPLAGTLRLVNPLLLTTERDDGNVLHWVLGASGSADEKAVFDRDGYLQLGDVRLRLVTLRNPHSPVGVDGHSGGVFELCPEAFRLANQAYAFGLSPETLGVTLTNSGTYQNVRENWLNHRDFGLGPWIAAVEDTLTSLLPGSQGVRVNTDGFANPPASERFATYKVALDAGVVTVDEVRALEGLGPLPESATPPPPAQLRPVADAQAQPDDKAS
jgi:hypothetical protein